MAILTIVMTACGGSSSSDEIERLQLELELARTQLELQEQQQSSHATIEQPASPSNTIVEEAPLPAEQQSTIIDANTTRQEMAARFIVENPAPVGVPPVGRWYRTFSDGNPPSRTGGYTIYEIYGDGRIRVYQRYWGNSDEGFQWEGTWTQYSIDHVVSPAYTQQQDFVRAYNPDGTTRRLAMLGDGTALQRVNEAGQFYSGWSFTQDVPPVPGWHYAQIANIPLGSITGNWYYDDTIWPPPLDANSRQLESMFFVNYELGESGRLLAHYQVDWSTATGLSRTGAGRGPYSQVVGRWSFENNLVHFHFDTGATVSYSIQGNELHSSNVVLQRQLNVDPEHQRRVATEEAMLNAAIRNIMNRVIGQWHWDLALWYFAEDGTGYMYSPRIGMNPESQRHFTFEVLPTTANYDASLIISFSDEWSPSIANQTIIYWVNFGMRSGGSMEFRVTEDSPPLLFTRMFDTQNTPFVDQMIDDFNSFMNLLGNFVN